VSSAPGPADVDALLAAAARSQQTGRLADAATFLRRVLAMEPGHAEAQRRLRAVERLSTTGAADDFATRRLAMAQAEHRTRHEARERLSAAERVVAQSPQSAVAHRELGDALAAAGSPAAAVESYREALRLTPDAAEVHNNIGCALRALGQLEEAAAAFEAAVVLAPGLAAAHNNLGSTLLLLRGRGAALGAFARAVALDPASAVAHYNLGCSLLAVGDYAAGWREYEWRWGALATLRLDERRYAQPRWDGAPLDGRTILIYAEQGLGDTVQFSRFLPLVADRGGRVVFECQPPLERLMQGVAGADVVVARGAPLPAFDVHAPLMSLPAILGTTLDSLPPAPALHPPSAPALPPAPAGHRRVGVAWAGSPAYPNDRHRSCPASALAPLLQVRDVTWYSLLPDGRTAELTAVAGGATVHDLGRSHPGVAEVAAAVAELDLVITVDTLFGHLAGTLGRPTWVLLAAGGADWRWLIDRDDSPWYPTVRLFWQERAGDWSGPIGRVRDELVAPL